MAVTGDGVLVALIILAGMMTLIARGTSLPLFRLGAALSWLALAFLLLTGVIGTSLSQTWAVILVFCFVVMFIAVLLLQVVTETRHESAARGRFGGFPGTKTASWTTWGPRPGPKANPGSAERQNAYKETLRDIHSRAAVRSAARTRVRGVVRRETE